MQQLLRPLWHLHSTLFNILDIVLGVSLVFQISLTLTYKLQRCRYLAGG